MSEKTVTESAVRAAFRDKKFRNNVIALTCATAVCGLAFGMTFPLLSLILESWGTDERLIGANAAMFALAALTFLPFLPKLLSRFGIRLYFQVAILVTAVCLICFKLFPNLWAWFPLRYITGAAINSMFVAGEVWIMTLAPKEIRGRAIAIFSMSLSGGFAIGPIILSITGPEGWLPFATGAIVITLGALPLFWADDVVPTESTSSDGKFSSIWKLAPLPIIGGLAFGVIENSEFNFLPIYAVRTAFTMENAMILVAVLGAGDLFCQWFIGGWSDRFDRRKLLTILAGVCGLLAFILPYVIYSSPFILFPILFVWGGATMGIYTVSLTILAARFEGAALSRANALLGIIYGLGAFGGPIYVGAAMDRWDPHGMPLAIGFAAFAFMTFSIVRLIVRPGRAH